MRHGDEVEEARLNSQMNSGQSGKFHKRGKESSFAVVIQEM